MIAGGYAGAGAPGLRIVRRSDGQLTAGEPVAGTVNVSAGIRRGGAHWFVVDERANQVVLLDADDGWRERARVASGGEGPCHLALDDTGRLLAVANYGSGTTALFGIGDDGAPILPPAIHRHVGSGPVPGRQEGPHAHWAGFGPGGILYVADLGGDAVLAFDVVAGTLGVPRVAYAATPGSGPRQLFFCRDRPLAYLVSELASTLTVLDVAGNGTLVARQIVSTLPAGTTTDSLGGAIAVAADRVYVSNRGHDSVATFAIDGPSGGGAGGSVRLLGHRASGGRSPRFLLVDGDHLIVAHEQAGGITALPLDERRLPGAVTARADMPGAAFLGEWP